jgi:Fe2+ transport system protein FeoA
VSQPLTLDQLKAGESAEIAQVRLGGPAAVRLMEMGLFEGVRVTLLRRAPLGDPLELQVGDYRLSLRSAEAAQVELKP